MTNKMIPVSMSYQLPDQVSPSLQMITTTVEQLNEATDLMRGTHPSQISQISQISTTTPAPLTLKSFTTTMNALNEDLALYEAVCLQNNHLNPVPTLAVSGVVQPALRLSSLRNFMSSPKQVAKLLGCNGAYSTSEEDPLIYFSRLRMAPAPGYYQFTVE